MEFSNVSTLQRNIPAAAWGWRSASERSNAPEDGSGSNQSSEQVRRFTLRSRAEKPREKDPRQKAFSILLIEDSLADAGLVREALEEHGIEGDLLLIGDGDHAIRYIRSLQTQPVDCPDLVIIDLNLPKRTGHEVLQSMRQDPKCRHAPAVILSSSDASEDRAESMRLGATQYIRKPLRLKEFLNLGAIFKEILEAAG